MRLGPLCGYVAQPSSNGLKKPRLPKQRGGGPQTRLSFHESTALPSRLTVVIDQHCAVRPTAAKKCGHAAGCILHSIQHLADDHTYAVPPVVWALFGPTEARDNLFAFGVTEPR